MDQPLHSRHCVPCEGGTPPLSMERARQLLSKIKGWVLDGQEISKDFRFKNFKQALAFINKVGKIAEAEGHHPDIFLHNWRYVRLTLTTHAIGGLSDNDFILAAKTDAIEE